MIKKKTWSLARYDALKWWIVERLSPVPFNFHTYRLLLNFSERKGGEEYELATCLPPPPPSKKKNFANGLTASVSLRPCHHKILLDIEQGVHISPAFGPLTKPPKFSSLSGFSAVPS